MAKFINSDKLASIGPYSHAVIKNRTVYLSGQLGVHPETKAMGATIEEQTHNAFANVEIILAQAGLTLKNVVKVLVLLKNIGDFAAVNGVYETYFEGNYPARSCFEVANLPANGLVEIEVIAECEQG